jgi:hypothetical protein
MKQLSLSIMGLALFGCPFVRGADATLPPATASAQTDDPKTKTVPPATASAQTDDPKTNFAKIDKGLEAKCLTKNQVLKLLDLPQTKESWGAEFAGDPAHSGKEPNQPPSPLAPPLGGGAPQVSWDNGCGCAHGGLIGGVGLYVIEPYFSTNRAFVTEKGFGGGGPAMEQETGIDHHMQASPEVWLGYISDSGLGGRLRWWYFREDSSQFFSPSNDISAASADPLGVGALHIPVGPPFSGLAQTLNVTSKLELQVWDLEALQAAQLGGFDLLFSGGVRLAHIDQQYDAYLGIHVPAGPLGPPFPVQLTNGILSGHSFTGAGPLASLEARRPLGNSGFALYGLARGSVLIGSGRQTVTAAEFASPASLGGPVVSAVNSQHQDPVIPVGEFEVGAEFGRTVGRARLFGQLGFVGQMWWGAGNASNTDTVTSNVQNLGFFGLAVRAGINY